ncbi:hypothetical protein EGR_00701 [Echinococcus granulosus]|nr:hypothetical protein EGR_00701 [Echinococcus granulosus]EUB64157.1 hypothetical protein EGR_00701 [Echinococcus granulosus]
MSTSPGSTSRTSGEALNSKFGDTTINEKLSICFSLSSSSFWYSKLLPPAILPASALLSDCVGAQQRASPGFVFGAEVLGDGNLAYSQTMMCLPLQFPLSESPPSSRCITTSSVLTQYRDTWIEAMSDQNQCGMELVMHNLKPFGVLLLSR